MSVLTEVLDSILAHVVRNRQRVETLQPGLSENEIQTLIAPMPFRLPREVHELYRWRNGSVREGVLFDSFVQFTPGYRLMPLQEAVDGFLTKHRPVHAELYDEWYGYDLRLFPFLNEGRNYYSVQGNENQQETGLIFDDWAETYPNFICGSLLGFFLAVEECWAEGVYSIAPDAEPNPVGWLPVDVDHGKEDAAFEKYTMLTSASQLFRWPR